MAKNTSPKESQEQIDFIDYCKAIGIRVVSTQNGMYLPEQKGDDENGDKPKFNRFAYINRQKQMGLSEGFPDLIVYAKNEKHSCLHIEMKRQKGGVLSVEQEEWIQWLDENDYAVGVAHGCDSAIRMLNNYLENKY